MNQSNKVLYVNLIATYEDIMCVPSDERVTEYFGDYGGYFFKYGITDDRVRHALNKALDIIGLSEDEYIERQSEFIYRANVEAKMNTQINNIDMSM